MKIHKLVLGMLATNCYIIANEDSGNALIIDAPDEAEKIISFINDHNYHVKGIVLTHCHFDHILALEKLKYLTGAPTYAHENSKRFLHDGIDNLCHYCGIEWTPVDADVYLTEGSKISLDNTSFEVIYTPGHTSDCICLYGGGVLISGATLFAGSIGRTDHPTGSMEQEISSIKNKLLPLPDDTPVYPGHGPETTIGNERRGNPYLQ